MFLLNIFIKRQAMTQQDARNTLAVRVLYRNHLAALRGSCNVNERSVTRGYAGKTMRKLCILFCLHVIALPCCITVYGP